MDDSLFYDPTFLTVVGLWIAISVAVGFIANTKGRNWFSYFVMSLVLSPVIAMVALLKTHGSTDPTRLD